ncbi:SOAT1 acyltransferase, partial [Polypterus senegalus]
MEEIRKVSKMKEKKVQSMESEVLKRGQEHLEKYLHIAALAENVFQGLILGSNRIMASEGGLSHRSRRMMPVVSPSLERDAGVRGFESDGHVRLTSNGCMDLEHIITKKRQMQMKTESLRGDLMKRFDAQVKEFVEAMIEESISFEPTPPVFASSVSEKDKMRQLRPSPEQGKLFISRRSLLDELFEVNHIRTIYHMFIALLILFIISTLVVDFIDEGRLVLDFSLLVYAFGNFPLVVSTWLCMFLSTFTIPYALLHQWAHIFSVCFGGETQHSFEPAVAPATDKQSFIDAEIGLRDTLRHVVQLWEVPREFTNLTFS